MLDRPTAICSKRLISRGRRFCRALVLLRSSRSFRTSHVFVRVVRNEVSHWKGWTLHGQSIHHQQGFRYRLQHSELGTIEGSQTELVMATGALPAGIWGLVHRHAIHAKGWRLTAAFADGQWTAIPPREKKPMPPMAEDTKRKLSAKATGRVMSAETKLKKSIKMQGKKMPEGTGGKISAKLKGRASPLKGRG